MGHGGQPRPEEPGQPAVLSDSSCARLVQIAVRLLVALTAGIMAGGFLEWRAGVLVAVLIMFSYLLLDVLGPHLHAPYGRGRLLRTLHRNGYHVLSDGCSRHVAVGPGGVYLLETRTWQHAVSWSGDDWLIGYRPATVVGERFGVHATDLERSLLSSAFQNPSVVPVITVAGRLPEPVMRAGQTIIARPHDAIAHILDQPIVLSPSEADRIADQIQKRSR